MDRASWIGGLLESQWLTWAPLSGPAALVTVAPFSPTVSRELMFPLPTTTRRPGTTAAQVEGSGKGVDPAYSPNSSLIWFSPHWPPFIMMSCYPLSPACLTSDEWEVWFSTGHSLPRSRPCRSPQVRASPHVMGNITPYTVWDQTLLLNPILEVGKWKHRPVQ